MALTNPTSSYVTELINAGPDALSNLYYLEFEGGVLGDVTNKLKVRATDFTPPAFNQPTDTKNYMSVSVDLPKPEIQGDKKLSFTFRVDEYFQVYKALIEQKKKTSVTNFGYVNPNVHLSENNFTVKVYIYKGQKEGLNHDDEFKPIYIFENCWIREINGLTFSYDSATPLTVKVEVSFQKFTDPETTIKTF